jgi:hypothetical protein
MDGFFDSLDKHFLTLFLVGWLVTCAIARIIRAARGEGDDE